MRISLPKSIIRKVQRAIVEFGMLKPHDRVVVGLSGGKDSSLLLYALAVLTRNLPFPVDLAAFTVDLGFKPQEEMDYSSLSDMCRGLAVPFSTFRAELAYDILNNPEQNPCARCSYFRRAIIHNYAQKNGYNKVAFAHHYDDAVETFLMGILYSGQISTFLPVTFLDRTGVTVIRPLIYLREKNIKNIVKRLGITPLPSPCPRDGITKRAAVKELIRTLDRENHNTFEHLAAAMREGRNIQLWPAEPSKEEIYAKGQKFWKGSLA